MTSNPTLGKKKGIKITTEKMRKEEFLKTYPYAIIINTEEDFKKLAEKLGVKYPLD